jgi:3-oxoacyl-[acyl-carrier protein] reductase
MAKFALVTGAGRGIGRAVGVELARRGYRVLINYLRNDVAAAETLAAVREAGSDGELMRFDVSDGDAVATAIAGWKVRNPEHYIEVLVNNAGIKDDALMMWMERLQWEGVLNASLGGFFNVTQAILKDMLARKQGRIINVVSLSGIKGLPGQTNYSAAKGGVIAATKALAQEVAKKRVTVNAVAPGFIRTDMTADLDEAALKTTIPAGRFGEPEEVASVVGFLASAEAAYITGEVISINGGLYT